MKKEIVIFICVFVVMMSITSIIINLSHKQQQKEIAFICEQNCIRFYENKTIPFILNQNEIFACYSSNDLSTVQIEKCCGVEK